MNLKHYKRALKGAGMNDFVVDTGLFQFSFKGE